MTILGTAVGSAKVVEKLLGPTADYIGQGIAQWTERRVQNVARIMSKAAGKLGQHLNDPGSVSPKVLREILDNGSFCDDELGAEYFGGVLASSRTEIVRDDRGAAHLKMIGRLSSYQIRAHYVFYSTFKKLFDSDPRNLALISELQQLTVYIPETSFKLSMAFTDSENTFSVLTHITNGLARENLIGTRRLFGSAELITEHYLRKVNQPGICFCASTLGLELFLWTHGLGHVEIKSFLDTTIHFPSVAGVEIPNNAEHL